MTKNKPTKLNERIAEIVEPLEKILSRPDINTGYINADETRTLLALIRDMQHHIQKLEKV